LATDRKTDSGNRSRIFYRDAGDIRDPRFRVPGADLRHTAWIEVDAEFNNSGLPPKKLNRCFRVAPIGNKIRLKAVFFDGDNNNSGFLKVWESRFTEKR
jgi:hypothetical protein